jgi:hypothetical protein
MWCLAVREVDTKVLEKHSASIFKAELHGITSKKIVILIATAKRTSNFT